MSGGAFDYVYHDVEDERIFTTAERLEAVEKFLRDEGKHDVADEVLRFRLNVETHQRILMAMGRRIAPLLEAAEWWASGDYSEGHMDTRWQEFLEGKLK